MIMCRPARIEFNCDDKTRADIDRFVSKNSIPIDRINDVEYLCGFVRRDLFDKSYSNTDEFVRSSCLRVDEGVGKIADIISALFAVPYKIHIDPLEAFIIAIEDSEWSIFESYKVIREPAVQLLNRHIFPQSSYALIFNRPEAAKLLAAALNAGSSSAQLTAYVRLFEAAFTTPHQALKKPLHLYLSKNNLGYTKIESDRWIALRHGIAHADRNGKSFYDVDAHRYIGRLRQAAYDVAFNKLVWRSPSVKRLSRGHLTAKIDENGKFYFVEKTGNYRIGIFSDPFGRFPGKGERDRRVFNYGSFILGVEKRFPHVNICGLLTMSGFSARENFVGS